MKFTRRQAILGSLSAGSAAAGASALRAFGGDLPAAGAAFTCFDPAGFQYRLGASGTCRPTNYATACNNGCYRPLGETSETHCISTAANSRHRTCGEDNTVGVPKQYALRTNSCWSGSDPSWDRYQDGWEWRGADGAICCSGKPGNAKRFFCNDGYYRKFQSGAWTGWIESICMTTDCNG